MNRTILIPLTVFLLTASLAGCAQQKEKTPLTSEERTRLYQTAIENARDQETNEYIEIITSPDAQIAPIIFAMLDLEPDDMSAYAISVSPVNVRAYGVAAIYPAAGKDEDVKEALHDFIDNQKQSFESSLEAEYEIASNARLETLEDGTLLLAMCPDQDAIFDAIRDTIEGAQ